MVFICNPNNPTGNLTNKDIILKISRKAIKTNTIVVIDESFLDFVKDNKNYTAIDLLEDYNNIFIIKSMTKFFAIPGIRIGYGISKNKDIIKKIDDISVPWNINVMAERAAIVALDEKEYIDDTIEYIEDEKNFLFHELSKIEQIKVFKPEVNFIMFKTKEFIDLKEKMLSENIIIRSCGNYKGLDRNYYRIAVRTRVENEKFISTLKNIIK